MISFQVEKAKGRPETIVNAKNEPHYISEDVSSANINIANTIAKIKNIRARLAKSEYSNGEEIMIAHAELKPGGTCPLAYCTGNLYQLKASAIF